MRRQLSAGQSVTEVVVRAVAEVTGRGEMDLRPLGESIDPDALDSLWARSSEDCLESLTFRYEGCRVTVEGDGVTVEDASR